MDIIDLSFAKLSSFLADVLPPGPLTSLLTEGIIPGIGGIVIFIPQIAILFAFLSILEETGYMARVVFLMDKVMRKFGLNGKSVVPLMSGVACAIPAVMATRTIDNWSPERFFQLLLRQTAFLGRDKRCFRKRDHCAGTNSNNNLVYHSRCQRRWDISSWNGLPYRCCSERKNPWCRNSRCHTKSFPCSHHGCSRCAT